MIYTAYDVIEQVFQAFLYRTHSTLRPLQLQAPPYYLHKFVAEVYLCQCSLSSPTLKWFPITSL